VSPPDVQVAVGPDHVVEMVNLLGSIWTRTGAHVRTFDLATFFDVDPQDFISDPKILFDAGSARWFATITDIGAGRVILAVSRTENPAGGWNLHPLDASTSCADQPILGVNDAVVVVSANDFSGCTTANPAYVGAEYWVINKTDLVTLRAPRLVSFGPFLDQFSVHPVHALTSTSTMYLVSVGFGNTGTLTLFTVTGVPPAPVAIRETNLAVRTIPIPPNAPQEGSRYDLDTSDGRARDTFWANGKLWLALNAGCTPPGDNRQRACVRLLEVDTTTETVLQDTDLGESGRYLFYPALRPDDAGNLYVVFTSSSSTEYAGIRLAVWSTPDQEEGLILVQEVRAGEAPEESGCPSTAYCRYGDYFGAAQDPLDPTTVWLGAQYPTASGWTTLVFAASSSLSLTFSYSVAGGGTGYGAPVLTYVRGGQTETAALTTSAVRYAMDAGSTWSVSSVLPGSNGTERWATPAPTSGIAMGPATFLVPYTRQFFVPFSHRVVGGGFVYGAPSIQVVSFGVPSSILGEGTVWADASSAYEYPSSLPGSTDLERWFAVSGSSGTVASADPIDILYVHQYFVTLTVDSPVGGTVVPTTGWFDAGGSVVLQVDAPEGWGVGAWVGEGSGSYTGSDRSPTILVNAPLREAVRLYPGLTIRAEFGGSVEYAYGGMEGSVPAGSTRTLYVPVGTSVQLTALGSTGFEFRGWSGNVSAAGRDTTVVVTEPTDVGASFSLMVAASYAIYSSVAVGFAIVAVLLGLWVRRRRRPPVVP